eukprot:GFYU01004830.1.p1 GENE.GFYU01004830.1~~GFYU01004830.1.p1  ORF type:complete len:314 (-),score=36.80 GFYU01004830.1:575-1516(-)
MTDLLRGDAMGDAAAADDSLLEAHDWAALASIATFSFVHTLIPTHWLCFSLVGKGQKWSLSKVLGITAIGGCCHVLSTFTIGALFGHLGRSLIPEEMYDHFAAALFVLVGALYLIAYVMGLSHHHHHHDTGKKDREDRAALIMLILIPTMQPCAGAIPMFLEAWNGSLVFCLMLIATLLVATVPLMLVLVTLSFMGVNKMNFSFIEKNDKAIFGVLFVMLGFWNLYFHTHDHDHGPGDGHDHGGHIHAHGDGSGHDHVGDGSGTGSLISTIGETMGTIIYNNTMSAVGIGSSGGEGLEEYMPAPAAPADLDGT